MERGRTQDLSRFAAELQEYTQLERSL